MCFVGAVSFLACIVRPKFLPYGLVKCPFSQQLEQELLQFGEARCGCLVALGLVNFHSLTDLQVENAALQFSLPSVQGDSFCMFLSFIFHR